MGLAATNARPKEITASASVDLVAQLNAARAKLDSDTELMQWAIDLREMLRWGALDIDVAHAEIAAFRCACRAAASRPGGTA